MNNSFLAERVARDIDAQVGKVLKDLGNPSPPLNLADVRALLRLDLQYYSSSDVGLLTEVVHRLRIGAKRIGQGEGTLGSIIKKLQLVALLIPDRKAILLDSGLPKPKFRWAESHEIGHSIIPWHAGMMQGDESRTLSLACQEKLEAEANFAAGRLLFFQDDFRDRLLSGPVSIERVKELSKEFSNSITTTLWRTVEAIEDPAFGILSMHPQKLVSEEEQPVRHFIRSRAFAEQFSKVDPTLLFFNLGQFCWGVRGHLGNGEILIPDDCGRMHVFHAEVFFNHHDALTLGTHESVREFSVAVI